MLNIDDRFLTESTQDQFWLMCHIAKFMNEDSTCFPSNKTLCERTGWKISKLNEVKKACIDAGLLKSETRYHNNRQSTNEYTILTDRIYAVVNMKGRKAKQIPTTPAVPCHAGGTPPATLAAPPPATLAAPEVLISNEVLTNEVSVTPAQTAKSADLKTKDQPLSKRPGAPELLTDVIAQAESWMAENPEQRRVWVEIARFTGDIKQEVAKFFSHYWRETGQHHKCRTEPIQFFCDGFPGWLINAKTFNRPAQTPGTYASTTPEPRGAAYQPFPKYDY